MRWPWQTEQRDSSFTDTLIQTIVAQASGATLARPSGTGALEASASIIARCFAAAQVSGPPHFVKALGPSVMSMIGRSLIRQGEILFAIEVAGGRVMLTPAASWDVEGDSDPASWSYRLVLGGPSVGSRRFRLWRARPWSISGSRPIPNSPGAAFRRWRVLR